MPHPLGRTGGGGARQQGLCFRDDDQGDAPVEGAGLTSARIRYYVRQAVRNEWRNRGPGRSMEWNGLLVCLASDV